MGHSLLRFAPTAACLWANADAGDLPQCGANGPTHFFIRRAGRHAAAVDRTAARTFSRVAYCGLIFAPVSCLDRRRGGARAKAYSACRPGYYLRRDQYTEAGEMDVRAPGLFSRGNDDRSRGGIRFSCGQNAAGTSVDAAQRPRMAVPAGSGTGAALEALSARHTQISPVVGHAEDAFQAS